MASPSFPMWVLATAPAAATRTGGSACAPISSCARGGAELRMQWPSCACKGALFSRVLPAAS
eukprot:10596969-Alexandrium_andersonii.AAC.1